MTSTTTMTDGTATSTLEILESTYMGRTVYYVHATSRVGERVIGTGQGRLRVRKADARRDFARWVDFQLTTPGWRVA